MKREREKQNERREERKKKREGRRTRRNSLMEIVEKEFCFCGVVTIEVD